MVGSVSVIKSSRIVDDGDSLLVVTKLTFLCLKCERLTRKTHKAGVERAKIFLVSGLEENSRSVYCVNLAARVYKTLCSRVTSKRGFARRNVIAKFMIARGENLRWKKFSSSGKSQEEERKSEAKRKNLSRCHCVWEC